MPRVSWNRDLRLIQVSIQTRDCLVRFSENQISYDLFSSYKSIEDGPSAIYEQSTQNHASWPFPPLAALVRASIHLVGDSSGSVSCTCSSGLLHVCGCTNSWSHDHMSKASSSPPSGGCIQTYIKFLNSLHTFHVETLVEWRTFLHLTYLSQILPCWVTHRNEKGSSAVTVRPRIAAYSLPSAISNDWQVAYDTLKIGVIQSWLRGVRHGDHKTNIGRCRSECNTVSGLKFPHLSVPTMGHLPQPSTCYRLHDGRCRFAEYDLCWCPSNLTPPLCAYRFGNPRLNQAPILNTF